MKTIILCGGKGTRALPHTTEVPKPLMEVAGRPVLRHLMEIYAEQAYRDFVLAAGFKKDAIEAYAAALPTGWNAQVVDTGEETNTGARVFRCRDLVSSTFFVNYSDGLGNVNLAELLEFHRGHTGSATVTIVPLPSQYGTVDFDEACRVQGFNEKPTLHDHWINAGYFVFEPEAFSYWTGEDLERDVLPALAEAGQLYAYRHRGFWKSMDTYKDAQALTDIYNAAARGRGGKAPWFRFATHAYS